MNQKKEKTSEYLMRVYGLELNDLDITEKDSIEEVERLAEKYDLDKREDFTLAKAVKVMKPFATVTGNAEDGWLIEPRHGKAN